jgi:protein TonB
MQPDNTATFRSQLHYPHVEYEERVFTFIFLSVLLVGIVLSQYAQNVRIQKPFRVPKPEARKVAEIILKEPEPPKPLVKVTPQPEPPLPRKLTQEEKKKLTSPPPLSAVGSPKAIPKKPVDVKKMVARKGLLGMLSKESKDTSLRAYYPSKKRDVSKELDQALKNLSSTARKEGEDEDFLGVGNLPEVAKKGRDIGYILDAAKIGEVSETQVQFYGGIEDLPEEVEEQLEEGKQGRAASEIRKVVASYLGALRYLYNKQLRQDPTLKGKATVRFEIAPSGHITETVLVFSSLGSPPLEGAILDNIRKWRFPRIPEERGSVKVTYPFVFLPPSS